MFYDPAGNEVVAPKVFESAATDGISETTLNNGNFVIAYRDGGNSLYGIFVIHGKSHLSQLKVSNNEVRLWNYTKKRLR